MTQPTETGLTEPDNPSAWALARHIADHPVSVVQAAFRYLNAPLTIELHGDPAATPAGPAPATDRDTLRQLITTAVDGVFEAWRQGLGDTRPQDAVTDAVLAVVRAAAIRLWHQTNGLTEYGRGARWAIGELRVLAGEAQQNDALPPPEGPEYTPCACSHIEPEHEPNAGECYSCDCEAYRRGAQQDPTQAGPRRGDQFEQWLKAQRDAHRDTGHGVWSVLDTLLDQYRQHADTEPATDETQQGPAQDSEAVCLVAGCGHDEAAHTIAGCRECPRGWQAVHLFSLPAVARSGQPETDEETPRTVPCSGTTLGRRLHGPHRWQPQPGMDPVRCPGYAPRPPEPAGAA